ncbi:hypothetical protein MT49_1298 [Mycobacterium tuberculosis 49-02]|nr:hypothetical protein MT49_1298 [Mycobacterium tuberculosis 49-02]
MAIAMLIITFCNAVHVLKQVDAESKSVYAGAP